MKNVLVLGVGRCGKSTLAMRLALAHPNYHLISLDTIKHGFKTNLSKDELAKFNNYEESHFSQDYLASFLTSK